MSESALSQTFAGIAAEFGQYLGISRTPGNWTSETKADFARVMASALRQFYESHLWSFLTSTLSLAVSTAATSLPDDFAGALPESGQNDVAWSFTTTKPWPLLIVPLWRVLEKRQDYGASAPSG
jgi:hypothetical protein